MAESANAKTPSEQDSEGSFESFYGAQKATDKSTKKDGVQFSVPDNDSPRSNGSKPKNVPTRNTMSVRASQRPNCRATTAFYDKFEPQLEVDSEKLFQEWASDVDALLQVQDAVFKVKTKKGEKQILQGVSLDARGGDVLAMMGPSGAGKTTLLEFMTLSLKGGIVEGELKLNGEPFTQKMFQQHAAFVEQYDRHWGFLTCQEVMNYTAGLISGRDAKSRNGHVHDLMKHLGLLDCANTYCGNDIFKGLSGGQKKRLGLGMALLKSPSVLFLDEPTSGLDAAAAAAVMGYVNQMTRDAGMISIATIHSPSTELFMSIANVLFLANGRIAYQGPPAELEKHCTSLGQPLPPETNPADHFLTLINSEFVSRDDVDEVVRNWTAVALNASSDFTPLVSIKQANVASAGCTLLMRHLKLSIRDPTLYVGRAISFLISNTFFALVYIQTRDREQDMVVPKYLLHGWMVAVPCMFSLIAVYNANEEFKIIRKEIKNGMIPLLSYSFAVFFLQLPYMLFLSVAALLVPNYCVANANLDNIVLSLAVMTAFLWACEQSALFLALAFENPLVGMLGSLVLYFTNFLFSGQFLKPEFVTWPWKLNGILFPLRWTLASLTYLEYHGSVWAGAQDMGDGTFTCEGGSSNDCFGRTGDQVLSSLKHIFPVEPDNTVTTDITYILAYGAVFKILHIVLLVAKTQVGRSMKSPGTQSKTGTAENADGANQPVEA